MPRNNFWASYRLLPSKSTVTRQQALAWHRREAKACLKEKNAAAFLFHYFAATWNGPSSPAGRAGEIAT